ncbi:MAG TPA: glycoside hydrolase family 16 protein [Lentimicrobium sp.]|nr:glycoside hydrolase family 16 protein [Lentimicrobium sp.]
MKYLSAIIVLCSIVNVNAQEVRNDKNSQNGWTLYFNDEFNDGTLNKDKWITWFPYTDDGSDQCAFCRTHGNENQIFLDRNVVLENGILQIIAKQEDTVWFGEKRSHTSGTVHSRLAFGHGRFEIRAKLPEGEGFWPAIWTFGQVGSEVDIMEAGMQKPKRFHISVHEWNIRDFLHKRINVNYDLSEDFHIYGMEWDTTAIKFFIDNIQVWQVCKFTSNAKRNPKKCSARKRILQPVFPADNEKLFLILGLGIGNELSPFTKSPDQNTVFPNKFEIDYVRIYKREN